MLTKSEINLAREKAAKAIKKSGIGLTETEIASMDVADFGLSDLMVEGGQIVSLMSTPRVSAKIIYLFPHQTLPEHWHTAVGDNPGKEETFRVISGTLRLYIEGENNSRADCMPRGKGKYYTARNEHILKPCEQLTLQPNIKHWFQGGEGGVVLYSFSSMATCDMDPFTDPDIVRKTVIIDG